MMMQNIDLSGHNAYNKGFGHKLKSILGKPTSIAL